MTDSSASGYTPDYWRYLRNLGINLSAPETEKITQILAATNWEEPQSGLDCNNLGVLALIGAEESETGQERDAFLAMAIDILEQGASEHSLCAAHLALIHSMIGEGSQAVNLSQIHLQAVLQRRYQPDLDEPHGLIYLSSITQYLSDYQQEVLHELLIAADGYEQTLRLLVEVLLRSHMVFYNIHTLPSLHLAAHVCPQSASIKLRLGLACLANNQLEGLVYLQQAWQAKLSDYAVLQSLHLICRDMRDMTQSQYWHQLAQQHSIDSLHWRWTELPVDSSYTWLPFDHNILLAVEPSLRSIVTDVLLAEGEWFEPELEFWRNQVQPGMVVIDVGANAGIYSFSTAARVGETGRVVAVEPFPQCVDLLIQTCQQNQFTWVDIYAGAASDREGQIYLSLHQASELNEVVAEASTEDLAAGKVQAVPCATLDSLCDRYNLQRVDLLKIDAEGHELQVLQGSLQILKEFAPIILYENIAGSRGGNVPVAEFLQAHGYQLFRYQPYLQKLLPVTLVDVQNSAYLNLIALPKSSSTGDKGGN
ncbi:MAG: FkbM family methyltransferase [Aphanocapsa sp. GSE-SYN-MK-11-07L]|jgi:FkbM family methyltransferase|nr:FkbM family methyltransferase [Aphanocapsa sp. GSE-SYN-MK-11-07L]